MKTISNKLISFRKDIKFLEKGCVFWTRLVGDNGRNVPQRLSGNWHILFDWTLPLAQLYHMSFYIFLKLLCTI